MKYLMHSNMMPDPALVVALNRISLASSYNEVIHSLALNAKPDDAEAVKLIISYLSGKRDELLLLGKQELEVLAERKKEQKETKTNIVITFK